MKRDVIDNSYNTSYKNIIDDEIMIKRRYIDITKTYNKRIIITHKAEIKANKKTRDKCIETFPSGFKNLTEQFKHFVGVDPDGDAYTLLNHKIDMRLYGLNPENPDDERKWYDIGLKWISGEFNSDEIEIYPDEYYEGRFPDEDTNEDTNEDTMFDYYETEYGYYKSLKYPEWLK
jgi:hypothetical protein